jgi:hypothetical protein
VTQSIAPKTGDRLILRGADGYDEARFARVFNGRRPERYPAAVLVAESEDDVVEGVRLARDRGWKPRRFRATSGRERDEDLHRTEWFVIQPPRTRNFYGVNFSKETHFEGDTYGIENKDK